MSVVLCRLADIPDGQGKGLQDPTGGDDLFIVRQGAHVFGYRNVCPHQGTPLDWSPDTFMSPDLDHIQCATHAALFRIEDGMCVQGPCAGVPLASAPVFVRDGAVVLDDPG